LRRNLRRGSEGSSAVGGCSPAKTESPSPINTTWTWPINGSSSFTGPGANPPKPPSGRRSKVLEGASTSRLRDAPPVEAEGWRVACKALVARIGSHQTGERLTLKLVPIARCRSHAQVLGLHATPRSLALRCQDGLKNIVLGPHLRHIRPKFSGVYPDRRQWPRAILCRPSGPKMMAGLRNVETPVRRPESAATAN